MKTALDTPDDDLYAWYRSQYLYQMTQVATVLSKSVSFSNRK